MKPLKEILREELFGPHSTAKTKLVAQNIKSKKELQALIDLISPEYSYPTPEAAAWCLRHSLDYVKPHHTFICERLVKKLGVIDRDSLTKNILGTIKYAKIPESIYGELANHCLSYLSQPQRTKAVLYYSLEIMIVICKKEPDLSRELILICEELLPISSDAFKRKFQKVRKTLKQ